MKKIIKTGTVAAIFTITVTVLLACGAGAEYKDDDIISLSSASDDEYVDQQYSNSHYSLSQKNDTSVGEKYTESSPHTNPNDCKSNSNDFSTNNSGDDITVRQNALNDEAKETELVYVYVCGAVYAPDVYELSASSHVIDAIKAAGGAMDYAAVDYLNLALSLYDGQKIYVPTLEDIENGSFLLAEIETGGNAAIGNNDKNKDTKNGNDNKGLININTAELTELTTIPGIGESKAQKIIEYRKDNGGFRSIEDIMLIPGIKEGMFNKIKDYICVK